MKVIFSGDRNWDDTRILQWLIKGLQENFLGLTVIEGECPQGGLDVQARVVAQYLKAQVDPTPANWKQFGKGAGPIRNGWMITQKSGRLVFAFHDRIEESAGTLDMLRQAVAHKLPAYLISHVDIERLKEIEKWKGFKMTWWWVEGQRKRKSADGTRPWIPLYSARDEVHGKAMLRMILNDDPDRHVVEGTGKEKTNSKARSKEAAMLHKEFRDFRLVPPPTRDIPKSKHAKRLSDKVVRNQSPDLCPKCGNQGAKKVRKDDKKLWKCQACRHRWPRNPSEAPRRASEAPEAPTPPPPSSERPRRRRKPYKAP